jgi:hypothetical protein
VKSRIPSWSLIAAICSETNEVGFLPEFLAKKHQLYPVCWQPTPTKYRILAIHKSNEHLQKRFQKIIKELQKVFD